MIRLFTCFLLLFLLNNFNVNGQSIRIGISGNFIKFNRYMEQAGPSLNIEYIFNSTLAVKGSLRAYFGTIHTQAFSKYNDAISVGFSLKYSPVDWFIKPYIGAGFSYNFNYYHSGGKPSLEDWIPFYYRLNAGDDNVSADISGGLILFYGYGINIVLEAAHTFSKPAEWITVNANTGDEIKHEKVYSYNSLFFRIGIMIRISGDN